MAKKVIQEEIYSENGQVTKNILGSLLSGYKDTIYATAKPFTVPSGSLLLDSCVQVKTGTTIRMGGPAGAGKTSQSLLFAANYMKTLPKSKTVYVNAESKFSEELQGRTGMKFVFSHEEWDYGTVFVLETNIFDTICDILASLLKTAKDQGEHLCIIVDSVDMLTLAASLDKKMSDGKKPAGVNYLTKEMFRRLCPQIRAYNSLLILITQYSATFNLDPYSKEPPQLMEGNNTHALNHQASYAFYYRLPMKSSFILEREKEQPDPQTNKILGLYAKIDIKKATSESSGYMVEVPIKRGRVGNAIWNEKEVADLVLAYELAKKGGAWVSFDANIVKEAKDSGVELKEKINGINQLYDYLEEDKIACDWLKTKVESISSIRMQLAS